MKKNWKLGKVNSLLAPKEQQIQGLKFIANIGASSDMLERAFGTIATEWDQELDEITNEFLGLVYKE